MVTQTFDRFVSFSKKQIFSGDIDPTYPLLKAVFRSRRYARKQALWHTFVYLAFYDLGSADLYISTNPSDRKLGDTTYFKKAIERRGFRGNDYARKFLQAAAVDLDRWDYIAKTAGTPEQGWRAVRLEIERLPFCGSWSSYKFADLFANVHDAPITAPDIGVGGGSMTAGPVPGLARISGYNLPSCAHDYELQLRYYRKAQEAGVGFKGIEQFETALCDFNSLEKGRYYVGHDIDAQMEALRALDATYWEARRACYPAEYLGEVGGWFGVRKERMGRL